MPCTFGRTQQKLCIGLMVTVFLALQTGVMLGMHSGLHFDETKLYILYIFSVAVAYFAAMQLKYVIFDLAYTDLKPLAPEEQKPVQKEEQACNQELLKNTHKKPTEPGWYWFTRGESSQIVEVLNIGGTLQVSNYGVTFYPLYMVPDDALWAGPLVKPERN